MANIDVTSDGSVVTGVNDIINLNISGGGDVTIAADPTDSVDFFKIKFLGDTEIDNVTVDLSTFSQDDLRIDILQYDPSDSIGFIGGFDFYVDPLETDKFHFSYIGSDGNTYSGYIRAMDGGERDFTDPFMPITIICFADGTLIDTPTGPVPVETLRPGDMVLTRDSGPLPLRWVGRREITPAMLDMQPNLMPIEISQDTFGPGLPSRTLTVSPNHRIMISDWRVEMLFGDQDVLTAAKFLSDAPGIRVINAPGGVGYNHLLFDRHEIVDANGLPCESLYPGPVTLEALDDGALSEIRALFPEALDETVDIGPPARRILREFEARAYVSTGIHTPEDVAQVA